MRFVRKNTDGNIDPDLKWDIQEAVQYSGLIFRVLNDQFQGLQMEEDGSFHLNQVQNYH